MRLRWVDKRTLVTLLASSVFEVTIMTKMPLKFPVHILILCLTQCKAIIFS